MGSTFPVARGWGMTVNSVALHGRGEVGMGISKSPRGPHMHARSGTTMLGISRVLKVRISPRVSTHNLLKFAVPANTRDGETHASWKGTVHAATHISDLVPKKHTHNCSLVSVALEPRWVVEWGHHEPMNIESQPHCGSVAAQGLACELRLYHCALSPHFVFLDKSLGPFVSVFPSVRRGLSWAPHAHSGSAGCWYS